MPYNSYINKQSITGITEMDSFIASHKITLTLKDLSDDVLEDLIKWNKVPKAHVRIFIADTRSKADNGGLELYFQRFANFYRMYSDEEKDWVLLIDLKKVESYLVRCETISLEDEFNKKQLRCLRESLISELSCMESKLVKLKDDVMDVENNIIICKNIIENVNKLDIL
jgi:hypothetical protein